MSKTEDLTLIAKVVLLDDKTAYDLLVRKYQSAVRRFLLNLTSGDEMWSDDLAQETFIKAYLQLSSFKGISGFSSWLFRIAYHNYCDSYRTKRLVQHIDEYCEDPSLSTFNDFSPLKMDMQCALKYLKQAERTAILLFYMEDKSQKEIAKIMDCPLGTVKTHLLKGKEKLNVYLQKAGYS